MSSRRSELISLKSNNTQPVCFQVLTCVFFRICACCPPCLRDILLLSRTIRPRLATSVIEAVADSLTAPKIGSSRKGRFDMGGSPLSQRWRFRSDRSRSPADSSAAVRRTEISRSVVHRARSSGACIFPLSPGWGRRRCGTLLLLLLAFWATAATARAGELTIRQVGAWGGSVDAIHVEQQGDQRIAYIGSGVRMVILDVTNPGNLIELGSVMLDAAVTGLEVRDGYAYVTAIPVWDHPSSNPASRFCVVDVHDVTAPFFVARNVGAGGIGGVFRSVTLDGAGRVAYATPANAGPQAIDITDPTAPRYMGECGGGSPPLFSGSLQYWLNPRDGYVGTMDMSVLPDSCPGVLGGYVHIPEFQGAYGGFVGSALAGDYLYVTAHFSSPVRRSLLFVVDFSNLAAPVHVGTWGDLAGGSLRFGGAVAVSDGRLYWAGTRLDDPLRRTLVILDIATDPTNPTLIGQYSSDAEFTEIEVVGTTVYLGDNREGFTILDCSDPANPRRVGNYFSPGWFQQGTLDGGKLYVTDISYGLSILDLSDPSAPTLAGQWAIGDYTTNPLGTQSWGIAVRNGLAYVAAGLAGLQVVNVSDPAAPTLAGEVSTWPDGVRSVGLALSPDGAIVHLGTQHFVGTAGASVVNFDVTDVSNIVDVGSIALGGLHVRPYTIARRADGIAYVAREHFVVTLDLSDATNPTLLGTTEPSAVDIALNGDFLYAAGSGFNVFSVAGPEPLPVPVGNYDFGDTDLETYAVACSDGLVYTGGPQLDLRIMDVSTAASPVSIGRTCSAGAKIVDLIVDGLHVYAITRSWGGDGGAGVLVYQVFSPATQDPVRFLGKPRRSVR